MSKQTVQGRRARGLYWDAAWALVGGCTKISPGCDGCWSEQETTMRCGHPNDKISDRAHQVVWFDDNDHARGFAGNVVCREDNLELPLRTKKPTVFAVWNDLFHEDVPDGFRDHAYAVMALCPQHTFLVLTKRASQMAGYFADLQTNNRVGRYLNKLFGAGKGRIHPDWFFHPATGGPWSPIDNVWHGVTAENQQTANERIPHLLRVPGKRFVSIEPMLGPIDLSQHIDAEDDLHCNWCGGFTGDAGHDCYEPEMGIHAVLLGGESGKNARPMHPDWVRSVRDLCAEAGVSFFFKMWGSHPHADAFSSVPMVNASMQARNGGRILGGRTHDSLPWDKDHE